MPSLGPGVLRADEDRQGRAACLRQCLCPRWTPTSVKTGVRSKTARNGAGCLLAAYAPGHTPGLRRQSDRSLVKGFAAAVRTVSARGTHACHAVPVWKPACRAVPPPPLYRDRPVSSSVYGRLNGPKHAYFTHSICLRSVLRCIAPKMGLYPPKLVRRRSSGRTRTLRRETTWDM